MNGNNDGTAADYAREAAGNAYDAAQSAQDAANRNQDRFTALLGVLRANGTITAEEGAHIMRGGH